MDGVPELRLVRVEDRFNEGYPDVLYCFRGSAGWIELKHLGQWPVRKETPVHLPKLTLEQVTFAESWDAAGGRCWVLLQVANEYLMFPSTVTRAIYERRLTRVHLSRLASAWSAGKLPASAILKALDQKRNKII